MKYPQSHHGVAQGVSTPPGSSGPITLAVLETNLPTPGLIANSDMFFFLFFEL
jgi:hypothetical protein